MKDVKQNISMFLECIEQIEMLISNGVYSFYDFLSVHLDLENWSLSFAAVVAIRV